MPDYVLAIDQGTTGSTVIVCRKEKSSLLMISKANVEFPQHFPKPGWVEHNPNEIWASIVEAARRSLEIAKQKEKNFSEMKIVCIGITNQRETINFIDRKTSEPIRNSIVWQCKRSHSICERWSGTFSKEEVLKKTGLRFDPYFSASKIKWVLENDENSTRKIRQGSAFVGTIDSFVLNRLTGGKEHKTEPSNASRTLLFELEGKGFSKKLLEDFELDIFDSLPVVQDSASKFGVTNKLDFLPDGIPITGILGDQQAALFGQFCFEPGQGKCTYGTGAFLLVNAGKASEASTQGLLTTVAWQINGERFFAKEGAAFIAGAGIQYARDQLQWLEKSRETTELIRGVEAAPDVIFVPALSGLGVPYWNPNAKAAFLGLSRGTSKNILLRAVVEGIAFQVDDMIHQVNQELKIKPSVIRVDGGVVVNDVLMQFQADLSQVEVEVPENIESTAMGAAYIASMGAGMFNNISDLKMETSAIATKYRPTKNKLTEFKKMRSKWLKAVEAVQLFSKVE